MPETSSHIDRFALHDAPIRGIEVAEGAVRLTLDYAWIGRDHPENPHEEGQRIEPCTVVFRGVREQAARVWSESERVYLCHPEPLRPLEGEVIEFEARQIGATLEIRLAGFCRAGWAEWELKCASATFSWVRFRGKAWFEAEEFRAR